MTVGIYFFLNSFTIKLAFSSTGTKNCCLFMPETFEWNHYLVFSRQIFLFYRLKFLVFYLVHPGGYVGAKSSQRFNILPEYLSRGKMQYFYE